MDGGGDGKSNRPMENIRMTALNNSDGHNRFNDRDNLSNRNQQNPNRSWSEDSLNTQPYGYNYDYGYSDEYEDDLMNEFMDNPLTSNNEFLGNSLVDISGPSEGFDSIRFGRKRNKELSSRRNRINNFNVSESLLQTDKIFDGPPKQSLTGNIVRRLSSTSINDNFVDDTDGTDTVTPVLGANISKRESLKIQWIRVFPFLKYFRPPRPSRQARTIPLFQKPRTRYPPNVVRNQKYNVVTFLPLVLYEQFKFFFNLYFLLVALSQLLPSLKIGYLFTYFAPLIFVLVVSLSKEAWDDYKRFKRDQEANSTLYSRWNRLAGHWEEVPSSALIVGDAILIEKNSRVPADCILIRTTESSGSCFIRTDQLDGETDWKLRIAIPYTQKFHNDQQLVDIQGYITCEQPHKDIHSFTGNFTIEENESPTKALFDERENLNDGAGLISSTPSATKETVEPVTTENVLWANTVVASGLATGIIIYTGIETRSAMNTSLPQTKVGLIDIEINKFSKILAALTLVLSLLMVAMNKFRGIWYIDLVRFLILFSTIIPISLRVNLDFAKTYYVYDIMNDDSIYDTVVRTSSIPEELGRIEYLLSDKTGTLTKNIMELRKIHMGKMSYSLDAMEQLKDIISEVFSPKDRTEIKIQRTIDISVRIRDAIIALGLCHNVTPVFEEGSKDISYQASSPDEVAIVEWIARMGLTLYHRDRTSISLRLPNSDLESEERLLKFDILDIFPFTSESKRMGIITRDKITNEIIFYQKGADAIMTKIVEKNDWLDEECGNMAREGLRTLVIGRKKLSEYDYSLFKDNYEAAKRSLIDRNSNMQTIVEKYLENNLELLGLTGVEDKLQDDVKSSLEMLRNAGLKIWMLTGDKIETATCIALSSKLVGRTQTIRQISNIINETDAMNELDRLRMVGDCCLVIDGQSLKICLEQFKYDFIAIAVTLPAVVCCRVSPTQKAEITQLIKEFTGKRTCAIGDGGNDVSMIQAAHIGVGIVGKEGKQASLAADFSVLQFGYLTKLLLCHGRNSYKRSSKLVQFIMHRGLIISVMQAIFSVFFNYSPVALYQGMLLVGYSTAYTMAPVFSLVLDQDVKRETALLYPELYQSLRKGRSLNMKTFLIWVLISIFQGGVLMIMALKMDYNDQFDRLISLSFTALIANELLVICMEIKTWHRYMVISILGSWLLYLISMFILTNDFELEYILTTKFWINVFIMTFVAISPLYIAKRLKEQLSPPTYTKLES